MAQFYIHESNIERLEKKMASLEKKCSQSHCTFKYEITGCEYKTCIADDGTEYTAKYYIVEVEGRAQYNGWRFVATLDHHAEGNVIRAYDTELTIPDKYKTCSPECEHCKKIRSRKDTYIVYNESTQEFKQVGNSCLKEFTNGLSAEDIAFFVSIYSAAEQGHDYSGTSYNRYIDVEHILRYAFECFKNWGYQKASYDPNETMPRNYRSTRDRVTDYYYINRAHGSEREKLYNEMDSVNFNPDSEYAVSNTEAALEWIRNISEEEMNNSEYIRNLHVVCSDRYTDWRSLGILVSLTVTYMRHIDKIAAYEKNQKAQESEKIASQYVGEIKQRLTITCSSFTCLSSWESIYGTTFLYKFTDTNGNVFVWYASNPIEDTERVESVVGTVKDHSEYNGINQTVMTRCKVTLAPEREEEHALETNEVQEALDAFFDYVNS